ncbi:MAG: hypothetical protein RJA22_763 [Verrucomicrobiota bacterium]|jgi:outer membrane protein assembly factor BamB
MKTRMPLVCLLLGALVFTPVPVRADWPAWRGPDGQGITTDRQLPVRWSPTENVRWKVALPDRGNATPVIWGDRVFVPQALEKERRRTLMCLSRQDGRILWQKGVAYEAKEQTHPDNPYCSGSPATDGERVIVCHGSAGVFCYDMEGNELWRRDLGPQKFDWGNATSPVLHGNLAILYFGPGAGSHLLALDRRTGKTVWKFEEPPVDVRGRTDGFRGKEPGIVCTYSTPVLVKAGTREELIMSFPGVLQALDPATGRALWHCGGLNPLVYTSPIHAEGIVVAMGGYFGNSLAVRTGGSGDVTGARLWHQVRAKGGIGSGVIHDGHYYFMSMDGIAHCHRLATGEKVWSERLRGPGPKGDSWSSMVLAGDRIYILNQSADCIVLKASPTFEVLAANGLGNEMCNASVAPSRGEIFIRTYQHLWCIGTGGKGGNGPRAALAPAGN